MKKLITILFILGISGCGNKALVKRMDNIETRLGKLECQESVILNVINEEDENVTIMKLAIPEVYENDINGISVDIDDLLTPMDSNLVH